jgi:hypothetical protein
LAESYFFLGGASFCFNHNRIASATALPRAPFSLPCSAITLILNSLSRSSGRITWSTPIFGHQYSGTSVPKYLLGLYCIVLYLYTHTLEQREVGLNHRVSVDAEVVELRLPEDHRIQVKTAEDLEVIARKLCKLILHEVVHVHPYPEGSSPIPNGSHVLAVYDGPWVYYCELKAQEPAKEVPAQ